MPAIKQVSEGVWRWDGTDIDHGFPIVGYLVSVTGGVVLVDPPATSGSVDEIRRAGEPRAVMITSRWHVRGAGDWKRKLGVPIAAPATAGGELAEVGAKADTTLGEGDEYLGWRAIHLHAVGDKHEYDELAYWSPSTRTLILGDLLAEGENGGVDFGPRLFSGVPRDKLRPFVKRLLDLGPKLLLSSHLGQRADAVELLKSLLA